MRKLAALALLCSSCTLVSPPAQKQPAPATAPASPHGLTIEEDAQILEMEDRRNYDPAVAAQWTTNTNAPHRARIAMALGRIGQHAFVDTNNNGERDATERQAGVDDLIALVSDPDVNVRMTATFSLGEIGDAASTDALFKLAADENTGVAAEAAEALAKFTLPVAFPRYAALVNSGPEPVRSRAIRFLFRFASDEASGLAASQLESASSVIRQEAAYALSRRGFAPARERLELLLGDSNTLTRAYAATALGRIGAGESMPTLMRALGDIHPWVRTNAVVAVARVASKDATVLKAEYLPRMLAIVDDPDPGTRSASIEALGYFAMRNEAARKRLMETARNGSRWERELAAGAITKQFGDTDLKLIPIDLTGWAKVRVLEASGPLKKNGAALRKQFANDPEVLVRENVIGNIPDATADQEIDLIRPGLEDPDPIVRSNAIDRYALTKIDPLETKLRLLTVAESRARDDRENDARIAAIRALADLEFPERETSLRGWLGDRDPMVRRVAADLVEQKLKKNRPKFTPLPVPRLASDYAQIAAWARQPHTATIHMTRGVIEMVLLTQDAPMTAWNFADLAKKKYFDNTSFMRVVPNFVVQSGDPRNDQNGGPGYSIRDEINLQKYTRGAVGMALSGPDTGGSQFFITHSPQPHLDGGYTIFGRAYTGVSAVVDQTERGDRVETITIDEHGPVQSSELTSVQATPLPVQIGRMTEEWLLANVPEYTERKGAYQPDASVVEMISDAVQPDDRVEVFMGTWCTDSQREVPRFLKINEMMKARFSKVLPLSFVAVDRSKKQPSDLLAGKDVDKVATFIYYRGDTELGRIVETPNSLFEDDLLVIVARPRS